MNSFVFLLYLAAGSFSKLITIKHPTPGEQWAAGLEVMAVSYLLSLLVPPAANDLAAVIILLPHGAAVVGSVLAVVIDKVRLWWDARTT